MLPAAKRAGTKVVPTTWQLAQSPVAAVWMPPRMPLVGLPSTPVTLPLWQVAQLTPALTRLCWKVRSEALRS